MYILLLLLALLTALIYHVHSVSRLHSNSLTNVPRLGAHPGLLGATTRSSFQTSSKSLILTGYQKYRHRVYSLWTTGMDRAIVPHDFMPEFSKLSRSQLKLTASIRHAGEYSGMYIAEKGTLAFQVTAVNLTQNIGRLAGPALGVVRRALGEWVGRLEKGNGGLKTNVHQLVTHLVCRTTALSIAGPELGESEEWLTVSLGYARDSSAVQKDLGKHWRATWPVVAPFLASYKRLQGRFATARGIVGAEIERRKALNGGGREQYHDILQYLINQSKGEDASVEMIMRRMLFLTSASLDTTSLTCTNVIFELLGREGLSDLLRQEWSEVLPKDLTGLNHDHLKAMKITDSVMKESQRMTPLALVTFNRQLTTPLTLPDRTHLPAGTYFSVPFYPVVNDPLVYKNPETFDPQRFSRLTSSHASPSPTPSTSVSSSSVDPDTWTFASHNPDWPGWGTGKFACPGRFWAAAQIKLVLVALLSEWEVELPKGSEKGRPRNTVVGESCLPDFAQEMVLRKRDVKV